MALSSLARTEISLPRWRRSRPTTGDATRRARRRRSSQPHRVVGLDIQPGEVVAAQVRLDGGIVVERAVAGEINHNIVREGEVVDAPALGDWLKSFFAEHDLPTTVRVGLPSKRAVMRIVDLPPLTDADDIAAAIQVQAPEHIAMPLERAVLDHQVVGSVETPNGPRTRVILVAAHRDSITRVLEAVRHANLRPAGIDLAAFALTRAMYAPSQVDRPPTLYAHVAGVTTLAIARGSVCEFTRVSPVGLEQLSTKLAEREGVPVADARARLVDFSAGEKVDEAALAVLDAGLAELADDLEKTITFHASQSDGAAVAETVITGSAAAIPNFAEVLAQRMRSPVRRGAPLGTTNTVDLPIERAALAAGLAVEDIPA